MSSKHAKDRHTAGAAEEQAGQRRDRFREQSGMSARRSRDVYAALALRGNNGGTWREVGAELGLDHQQVTPALSTLHKRKVIARLTEHRHRCSVYVLPEHVHGRDTAPQGFKKRQMAPEGVEAVGDLKAALVFAEGSTIEMEYAVAVELLNVFESLRGTR